MPQIIKSKQTLLYAFLIIQLLQNIIITNAAVIRREKREIAANETASGTIISSNNDLYSTPATTEEVPGNFLYGTKSDEDVTTTEETLPDATTVVVSSSRIEETTSIGLTTDNNTVGFTSRDQDLHSENEEKVTNKDDLVETTTILDDRTTISSSSKGSLNESIATLATTARSLDIYTTTASLKEESASTMVEDEFDSTVQFDKTKPSEATTESKFDFKPTTLTTSQVHMLSTVKMDETTSTESTTEVLTGSQTLLDDSSDVMRIIKLGATTPALSMMKQDEITEISKGRGLADSTETIKQSNLMASSEDSATEQSTIIPSTEQQETITDLNNQILSTTNQTTFKQPLEDRPTPVASTPSLSTNKVDLGLTDEPQTSTLQSDETTLILTSTESSDEDPIQTTFYVSTINRNLPTSVETRNFTPASAEKRGKFIDDNYSSYNELRLPNTSDVWALAGMKSTGKSKSPELQNSVETSDEKSVNNSMVTKSLLDWSRVMMTSNDDSLETTVKGLQLTEKNTEVPNVQTTFGANPEQEVSTIKGTTDAITESVHMTDEINTQENKILNEKGAATQTFGKFETTTTNLDDKTETSTNERFAIGDSWLSKTDDIPMTTKSTHILLTGRDDTFIEDNQVEDDSIEEKLPSPTATVISTTVTVKNEQTNSPVNDDTTEDANTETTLIDFPKSIPFSTSTTISTTITNVTTITPTTFDNVDKPLNMAPTLTPAQTSPAPATIAESTTTTTPAVTVMATTTEAEPHMPTATIISNEMMTQKSNNYNNYELLNETATIFADTSSTETAEVSTRVAPDWDVITHETSTAEVEDRLDDLDFDVTTVTNFENNNNAYPLLTTPEPSTTTTTVANTLTTIAPTFAAVSPDTSGSTSTEELDRIDSIQKISDTAETSIESNVIDRLHVGETSTSTTTTTTTTTSTTTPSPMTTATITTETSQENIRMQSIGREGAEPTSSITTTQSRDESRTTLQSISTKEEDMYSFLPTIDSGFHVPKLVVDDATTTTIPVGLAAAGGSGRPMDSPDAQETDVNVIIAISVSAVGIIALILLVAFLYVMRKRQKQMSYGQRCRPVSLDAYSLDNVSVYNSVRRKGAALRASKRSYGNVAFDDPSLRHNVLGTHELAKYVEKKSSIWEEFKDVPQIIARADEVPAGCEDRNRYANVIPLPETRVVLEQLNGDEKSEYINANYVRGPKDTTNYYIACQAPLEATVVDFWRMIWEQNSRVIIMATDLIENGIDKCAEYLPPSVTLDNHTVFGDFQVTLKNREVKEKYAISTLMLKNTVSGENREITHYWYRWPEAGVPNDEAAIIAMLLEARSSLKLYTIEPSEIKIETDITDGNKTTVKIEINGNVAGDKSKTPPKDQGPLTIHCSPGTGRTGTILACDIAMRCLEEPKRSVDIPQIVYSVRRGRASAVQTKEQYEFIYKVAHMYATKISNINNDN